MAKRVLAFLISFCFIFEQAGFAQVAVPLGIPAYLSSLSTVTDKFRPVQLRSIDFDPAGGNYALLLDKGDDRKIAAEQIVPAAQKLFEYFRVGLALPNKYFWVNLRPDSPDEVIEPLLGKTDLGKVMLEADLQLKKDLCRLTSPDTAEGKLYWNKLYEKALAVYGAQDLEVPALTRPWIVPGEVIIRTGEKGAFIYKASLKVMLEQDHLKDSPDFNFSDPRQKEVNAYSSQLIRELIIPKLTREVNSSKRYAELHQVYYSLILAQWFKQSHMSQVDGRDLSGLTSKIPWSKDTYYQAYRKSFRNGEYNRQEEVNTSTGLTVRQYFSGGVQLDNPQILEIPASVGDFFALNNEAFTRLTLTKSGKVNNLSSGVVLADGGEGKSNNSIPYDDEIDQAGEFLAARGYSPIQIAGWLARGRAKLLEIAEAEGFRPQDDGGQAMRDGGVHAAYRQAVEDTVSKFMEYRDPQAGGGKAKVFSFTFTPEFSALSNKEKKESFEELVYHFADHLPVDIDRHIRRMGSGIDFIVYELCKNSFDGIMSLALLSPAQGYSGRQIDVYFELRSAAGSGKSLVVTVEDNGAGKQGARNEDKKEYSRKRIFENSPFFGWTGGWSRFSPELVGDINQHMKEGISASHAEYLADVPGQKSAVIFELPLESLVLTGIKYEESSRQDGGEVPDRPDAWAIKEGHYALLSSQMARDAGARYLKTYNLYDCLALILRDENSGACAFLHLTPSQRVGGSIEKIINELREAGAGDTGGLRVSIIGSRWRDEKAWAFLRSIRKALASSGISAAQVEENLEYLDRRNILFDAATGEFWDLKDIIQSDYDAAEMDIEEHLSLLEKAAVRQPIAATFDAGELDVRPGRSAGGFDDTELETFAQKNGVPVSSAGESLTRAIRAVRKSDPSGTMVVIITGLISAGKTAVKEKFTELLKAQNERVVFLDSERFLIPREQRDLSLSYPWQKFDVDEHNNVLADLKKGIPVFVRFTDRNTRKHIALTLLEREKCIFSSQEETTYRQHRLIRIRVEALIRSFGPRLTKAESSLWFDPENGEVFEQIIPLGETFIVISDAALIVPHDQKRFDYSCFVWRPLQERKAGFKKEWEEKEQYSGIYGSEEEVELYFNSLSADDSALFKGILSADVIANPDLLDDGTSAITGKPRRDGGKITLIVRPAAEREINDNIDGVLELVNYLADDVRAAKRYTKEELLSELRDKANKMIFNFSGDGKLEALFWYYEKQDARAGTKTVEWRRAATRPGSRGQSRATVLLRYLAEKILSGQDTIIIPMNGVYLSFNWYDNLGFEIDRSVSPPVRKVTAGRLRITTGKLIRDNVEIKKDGGSVQEILEKNLDSITVASGVSGTVVDAKKAWAILRGLDNGKAGVLSREFARQIALVDPAPMDMQPEMRREIEESDIRDIIVQLNGAEVGDKKAGFFLYVGEQGDVQGMMRMYVIDPGKGVLRKLWVIPELRRTGQGIGTMLLDTFFRALRDQNIKQALIPSAPDAIAFYKKYLAEKGVRDGDYEVSDNPATEGAVFFEIPGPAIEKITGSAEQKNGGNAGEEDSLFRSQVLINKLRERFANYRKAASNNPAAAEDQAKVNQTDFINYLRKEFYLSGIGKFNTAKVKALINGSGINVEFVHRVLNMLVFPSPAKQKILYSIYSFDYQGGEKHLTTEMIKKMGSDVAVYNAVDLRALERLGLIKLDLQKRPRAELEIVGRNKELFEEVYRDIALYGEAVAVGKKTIYDAVKELLIEKAEKSGITANDREKIYGILFGGDRIDKRDVAVWLGKDAVSAKGVLEAKKKIMALDRQEMEALLESVPAQDGGTQDKDLSGIDFRALPVNGQPMIAPALMPQLQQLAARSKISDLDREWSGIQKEIQSKEMPYARLKEYIAVCLSRPDPKKHLEQVATCLINILKIEEEQALSTEQELKEILLYLG